MISKNVLKINFDLQKKNNILKKCSKVVHDRWAVVIPNENMSIYLQTDALAHGHDVRLLIVFYQLSFQHVRKIMPLKTLNLIIGLC